MNKEVLAMVKENWISPKQTGKTPQKRHHPVAKDSEIPHVPKKEEILVSKEYYLETPKRANIRARESLLEVQNMCLSPDALMASRKTSHLENIKEEPSHSSCDAGTRRRLRVRYPVRSLLVCECCRQRWNSGHCRTSLKGAYRRQ
ncbi:hypothetical protein Q1695_012813 [Nippostrongylus brasiliensis]|nr:hypothetical protein Q1695_012813 [Nippostrongylus brasiliensis]